MSDEMAARRPYPAWLHALVGPHGHALRMTEHDADDECTVMGTLAEMTGANMPQQMIHYGANGCTRMAAQLSCAVSGVGFAFQCAQV